MNVFEVLTYLNSAGYLFFRRGDTIEVVFEDTSVFINWRDYEGHRCREH